MMKPVKATLTTLLLMVAGMAGSAGAFDFTELENRISEHTLDNGLKIIVLENHEAPVASFVTYANVGSVDDPKGYTGLAHMFEHMAFKGTERIGSKDIDKELKAMSAEDSLFLQLRSARNKGMLTDSALVDTLKEEFELARQSAFELVDENAFGRIIDRNGGVGLNAGTGMDNTVYYYSLPSNKVELWMNLESDRFLDPVLREMYKERDVVAEERRMRIESSPFGKMFEEFLGLAYKAHPYRNSGIGAMSDIKNYSRKEAEAFFDKYYCPANLVVAIAGDVDPKEVFRLADEYFGRIKYRPAPPRIATVEPPQIGERREMIEDRSQPIYLAGWHIPEETHPDRPALDAMMDYLGQGRTSILYKDLVKEKKIAAETGAGAGFIGGKYPDMAIAYAVPTPGNTNAECEEEILAGIEQMKNELLPIEEVNKIKTRARAAFVNRLGSNRGMAMQLAAYQTSWGDWHQMFKELDRINAVTPEDIQRVAKKYFTKKNRVVVTLEHSEA